MKLLTCIIFFFPSLLLAQEKGIKFEQGRSWQQVQEKAKEENKFIFMDCYATWCGPCKSMDKDVYTKENVGDYMNAHFVSVKVQFDTSKNDAESTKSWYLDAHAITKQYKATAFPTFLFFSPDGQMVYQSSGGIADSAFLVLAKQALETGSQYDRLLTKYEAGGLKNAELPQLGLIAANAKNEEMADHIAKEYLQNYLDKLSPEDFFSLVNSNFMYQVIHVLCSRDSVFHWIYIHPARMDQVMKKPGISTQIVDDIITREMLIPALWLNGKPVTAKPDWNRLTALITQKFNHDYAIRNVLNEELAWYQEKKDWPDLTNSIIKQVELSGIDTSFWGRYRLNNICYDIIFKHSNNKNDLEKAAKWMKIIFKYEIEAWKSGDIDTYANLLYKAGSVKEAIFWEEKAEKLNEEYAIKKSRAPDKTYAQTIKKMKNGQRTW